MVRQLVFICDNFSISDSGYHEIAMTNPEVPRPGILLECRNEMDSAFEIQRTLELASGAYLFLRKKFKEQ